MLEAVPLHELGRREIHRATNIEFNNAAQKWEVRACFKIAWGPAARDFGRGRGGEARASPQRAVRAEPTKAPAKRPAARRVLEQKAVWLRCSLGHSPLRGCSLGRASPSSLFLENRIPRNFKTGSKGSCRDKSRGWPARAERGACSEASRSTLFAGIPVLIILLISTRIGRRWRAGGQSLTGCGQNRASRPGDFP